VPAGAIPLDITAIADGAYKGTGEGFHGPSRLRSLLPAASDRVRILSQMIRQRAGAALTGIPKAIVEQQKVDVDAVSGATYTSKGIIEAVKNALAGAPTK
jgi:uncharacterized protein with FMN-binding domain